MAVRVTGGEHRGRSVEVPAGARPTEGRVREALFSIWAERLAGARFLDLFAGSGVVSLEALSRGAASALAIDSDAKSVRLVKESAARLGMGKALEVRRSPLPGGLSRLAGEGRSFDLVFADPPYRFDAYAELIAAVAPLLAAGGELAVEHTSRTSLPDASGRLVQIMVRRYGESALSFYEAEAPPVQP